jgi:hypothetical protein
MNVKVRITKGNKMRLFNSGFFTALVFITASCSTTQTNPKHEDWNGHMRELGRIFSDLVPYLSSQNEFNKAAESGHFEESAAELHRVVSLVKTTAEQPHLDPSLSIVAAQFDHEIRVANKSIKEKKFEKAFVHLNNVNRYCISCHTLLETTSEPFLPELAPNFENMSFLQRGDFYLATRRFSDAVYEYERGLLDPSWAQTNRREWNDHMQRLLSVVVRVRNNPSFTLEMVSRFFDSNSYPNELRKYAIHWRRHIREWRAGEEAKLTVDQTARVRAEALLNQANTEAKINGSDSVRILALRASGILHEELASNKKAGRDPQILYLAGMAASYLGEVEIGAVPEIFFDRCVLSRPNSPLAAKCYARLKEIFQSARFKESLSPFVSERIDYLSALAKPKN